MAPVLQARPVAQPGESMLELLPNELLTMAVDRLAPADSSLENTVAYKVNQANLRTLCLVSKELETVARPALYRDVRLYDKMDVVHLCATFRADPTLASSVKIMVFCPPRESQSGDIRTIDLRPLRLFQDPDYAFWTRGRSKAKIRMPVKAREELVCILFSKALSRIPALQSLSFSLPKLRSINPQCLKYLQGGAQLTQQLSLQESLMEDFCQGRSLPDLSKLSTVGMLGTQPMYDVKGLRQRLLRSPNLHEVFFAGDHVWHPTLQDCYGLTTGPQHSIAVMSTSVKRVALHHQFNMTQDVVTLTTVFPSLESLTIEDGGYWPNDPNSVHGHRVLQLLGGLKNFHTLELGHFKRSVFATAITTETGPDTIVTLSGLSKLRTLLVGVDFFVRFTLGEEPQLYRQTTVLPDSLRRLTLFLGSRCQVSLAGRGHIPLSKVTLVVEPLLREVAPALLDEYPHLERVDLCYDMDDYREDKAQTLAERSTADGGSIL